MFNNNDNTDIPADKIAHIQEQKKSIHFHSIRPHKGHKLYEVDIDNETVNEIIPEKSAILSIPSNTVSKTANKVESKPNCLYISCLNRKNLIRLILNAGGQDISHYTFTKPVHP